jgi:hypothetical protein
MDKKILKIDDYTSFIQRLNNIEKILKQKISDNQIQIKDIIAYCSVCYSLGVTDGQERIKDLEWDTDNIAYGYKVKYEIYPTDLGGAYLLFINGNEYATFNSIDEARAKSQEHYNSRLNELFYGYEIEGKQL